MGLYSPYYEDTTSIINSYFVVICPYCSGNHHKEQCHRVEEIEYYRNGRIKRVKLKKILPVKATIGFTVTLPEFDEDEGE